MSLMLVAIVLAEFAKTVIVPALIAGLTAYLALGGHRRGRWWEKKYEAYSSVLLALHKVKRSFSDDYERLIIRTEPTDEQKAKSKLLYDAGVDDVMQYADIGELLMSKDACEVIRQYGRDIMKSPKEATYDEFLDNAAWTADKALKALIQSARADLLKERPFRWRPLSRKKAIPPVQAPAA